MTISPGALAETVDSDSITRIAARLAWLKDLDNLRSDVLAAAKMSPTIEQQLNGNFINSPVGIKCLDELRKVGFVEMPDELAMAIRTIFAMPGTVGCELSNKATRKQQDRAQEHCKIAGERIAPPCFAPSFCYVAHESLVS